MDSHPNRQPRRKAPTGPAHETTRILIVDDQRMFREGVQRLIEDDPSLSVAGQATSGDEALELCRSLCPHVAIVDPERLGWHRLGFLRDLKHCPCTPAVLVVTALPEEVHALRCLKAGADGFVSKAEAGATLCEAIHKVRSGGKYIGPSLAMLLVENVARHQPRARHQLLTDRELQVMTAIGMGRSASEIGADLGLSIGTVRSYRARILKKTGLASTGEVVRYSLRKGIAA